MMQPTASDLTARALELSRVRIRPLDGNAVLNRFCSGKPAVDRFLKNKAMKCVSRYEQRIFCAFLEDSANVIGYYALQLGSDSVADLPDSAKNNYLRTYTAFPAIHLSWIGVTDFWQRQGLGKYLLVDVFEKVASISQFAGFFALTLVSIDESSTAFYKSIGFKVYSENLPQPKMLYPLASILDFVRR